MKKTSTNQIILQTLILEEPEYLKLVQAQLHEWNSDADELAFKHLQNLGADS